LVLEVERKQMEKEIMRMRLVMMDDHQLRVVVELYEDYVQWLLNMHA
jgi:hypothetical protein